MAQPIQQQIGTTIIQYQIKLNHRVYIPWGFSSKTHQRSPLILPEKSPKIVPITAKKCTWRTGSPLEFSGSQVQGVLGYDSSWFNESSPEISSDFTTEGSGRTGSLGFVGFGSRVTCLGSTDRRPTGSIGWNSRRWH
jgi:hypothetical protein